MGGCLEFSNEFGFQLECNAKSLEDASSEVVQSDSQFRKSTWAAEDGWTVGGQRAWGQRDQLGCFG